MKQVKKKIGVGMLVVAATAILAFGGYYSWLITPPPMPKTVEEAGELLVSARYLRLPESRRFDYMQRSSELFDSATPQQKKNLVNQARKDPADKEAFKRAIEDRINMEMRNYALADDFDRRMIIDRAIGMQVMMTAQQAKKPPREMTPERQARNDRRKGEFILKIQEKIEQGNPQHQAYFGEFIKAMMTRREQMGLDPLPFDPNKK